MTKILIVYTGGTICSFETDGCRNLDVYRAKRLIENKFFENKNKFGIEDEVVFEDSKLEKQTLSENMTIEKLCYIARHIKAFDLSEYQGVIVLHGTDTLAYTASFLSFALADIEIPLMLVSGHKPPNDEGTNANENFALAVRLIAEGISPNVYAVYKNTDGKMWLHLGVTIMQCPSFSDDFENASGNKKFLAESEGMFEKCRWYSNRRIKADLKTGNSKKVLNIMPYTGLDYKNISLDNVGAIVHGTYHSGTVCAERDESDEVYGSNSILWLNDQCRKENIPVFIAPSKLSKEQYSSVYDVVENGGVIPLSMTLESAYTKAVLGVMNGLFGEELVKFMVGEINNEFI